MAGSESSTVVDLSTLKLHTQPHQKSSHKSILVEYGLREERRRKRKHKRPAKKTSHLGHYADDEDRERSDAKRMQKQEKYLQVLKDLDILKRYYYHEYMDLLRERVRKQHADIRRRDEERQKGQTTPSRPRRERHVIKDDKAFLANLEQSQTYEFIRHENKLRNEGKLRTTTDLDAFWTKMMTRAEIVRRQTHRPYKFSELSLDSDESDEFPVRAGLPSSLSEIREDVEDEPDMAYRPSKAPPRRTLSQKKSSKNLLKDPDEALFPRVEMPKLRCFTMKFGQDEEDPAETRREGERRSREKDRWLFKKRLEKMYQLAMTNTASAQRIMENHGLEDLQLMMDSSGVHDLIDVDHFIPKPTRTGRTSSALSRYASGRPVSRGGQVSQGQSVSECHPEREVRSEVSGEGQLNSSASGQRSASVVSGVKSRSSSARSRPLSSSTSKTIAAPLSMDDVVPEAKIMETKCLSTFWSNYAMSESAKGEQGI